MDAARIQFLSTALGGVIGASATWFATRESARAADRRDRLAHSRELARVRREAFALYLTAAVEMSNKFTLLVQSTGKAEPAQLDQVHEYHRWVETGTPLYFLLDEPAVSVLAAFEDEILREAARVATGSQPTPWATQIEPLLREMRRLI